MSVLIRINRQVPLEQMALEIAFIDKAPTPMLINRYFETQTECYGYAEITILYNFH